ncbi:hypothetical protein [Enterococcus caccae]|uniref:MucBP domain-containing protein n=1 Tax=Enterococcus caccae ATCC BAA-1240 TaxID=1158612 RepID=R3W6M8_9ENTE|nr:hypothetical protein [Enterococcus caccae]EOL43222.1 hypothetical protein UC7_02551 [Enterococcus caccae ATCC BAA-1240]EOT68378.1 hypothetical protein I580_00761 [Enterococcus caccae ATCC BAA-1240]
MIKRYFSYAVMFIGLVVYANTMLSSVAEAAEVWLPESTYWLDSMKNEIPKENTFAPMWSSKSEIIDHSDGVFVDKEGQGKYFPREGKIPFATKKEEWIKVSNIGYYNNSNINMKMTFKTSKPAQDDSGQSIDDQLVNIVGIKNYLGTIYIHKSAESAKLTFEFFDDQDKPINVSGYWSFKNLIRGTRFQINKNWVDKIYSVSRSFVEDGAIRPVIIKVEENNEYLLIRSTEKRQDLVNGIESLQSQAVMTYTNQNKIEFTVKTESDTPYIDFGYSYTNKILPKIEYPAPVGKEQTVKSITKDSVINQEFSQYLPYQSVKNRTKEIGWEIDAQTVDSLVPGDWKVTNETGTDSIALFSITTTNGKTTIKAKDKSQNELYGHYFYFERKIDFSKIPIDETLLKDQEGGKYLDTTGTVVLNTGDDSRLKTTFKTSINFLAKVNYHYLDQETTKPIPNLPDTVKTEMSGLITHSYPSLNEEIIPEYTYLSTTPTNSADQLIQYTQEDVSFLYGKLSIKSKKISVPLGMDTTKFSQNQLKDAVESIKLGENEITNYEISILKAADTSMITNDKRSSKMTLKIKSTLEGKLIETYFDVLVEVNWGNSVVLGGSGTNVNQNIGESTFALTLHEDSNQKPYLTGSYGNMTVDKDTPLDKNNEGDSPYYQVTYLDMNKKASGVENATEVYSQPLASTDVFLNASNQSTPFEMLEQFKQKVTESNGQLSVNYDDVIGIYVTPKLQQAMYTNDQGPLQPLKDLPNQQTVFYKITKSGFVPLNLDHLASKNVSIVSKETESKANYDAHYTKAGIEEYFNIPTNNAEYKKIIGQGFKTYPKLNLAVNEESTGHIYIAEQLSETNDKYLKYSYEVVFRGIGPDIQFEKIEALNFGTPEIKSQQQEIHQKNTEWQLNIRDNRLNKTAWEIQARITQPFQAKVGDTINELKGAMLKLKDNSKTIFLNQKMQKIYVKDSPETSNIIQWKGSDGMYLSVPPGKIKKDLSYQTEVEFLLSVGP